MNIVSVRTPFLPLVLNVALVLFCTAPQAVAAPATASDGDAKRYRTWIEEMKSSPRGPFSRIRWFCADGSVLPPKPYACAERGGGVQHGELGERARELRERGYRVANVLAGIDEKAFLAAPGHRGQLAQILIEQFLIRIDDGWILRRARYYRGALQEEGERRAARRLLLAMAGDDARLERDYALLRAAARLLPHGADTASASEVRQRSAAISDRDPAFVELRNKIHVRPEAGDADSVRAYARGIDDDKARAELLRLAADIDVLFSSASADRTLRELAGKAGERSPELVRAAMAAAARIASAGDDAGARFVALGEAMAALREALRTTAGASLRLAAVDAGLAVESEWFSAGAGLRDAVPMADRATRLRWLAAAARAAYGAGLVSPRQRDALAASLSVLGVERPTLATYKRELGYLSLVPAWGAQRLRFHFGDAMATLARIEPKAVRFIDDQLRGSPLLLYAELLDGLLRDANRLAGVRNEMFGDDVGAGLRALNPGLARGRLLGAPERGGDFAPDGIYVLPETESDLPPVAGILTAGEGNPLSHVQLLARNLGIPNVGVDTSLLPRLEAHFGRTVILAVSAAGSVRLSEDRGDGDRLFAGEAPADDQAIIRPDLEKLDLSVRELRRLGELRADDSGRTVGPKAAKLGELKHHFPDAVADGLAIPFGVFRALLDRPWPGKQGSETVSVFDWMKASYRRLEAMPAGSAERRDATERLRAELHDWIAGVDPGESFREQLRESMKAVFGTAGSYGVFVRSDTNVEDLPGFTGAGLNLTVPNVVGFDAVLEAIPRVWASPFTARAFAWRQAHMEGPEHVYPAVLLLKSVPAEKSGVMVTRDVDDGDAGWLSVAVNEGVGGAVDGQAAESLRIELSSGRVRLLAQATAPESRRIDPRGGVEKVPASGRDRVLEEAEIAQLIELARELPERFPSIVDAEGRPAPADVEFGFVDGKLVLFQIRPFLESRRARGSAYLNSLDAKLADLRSLTVAMDEVPR